MRKLARQFHLVWLMLLPLLFFGSGEFLHPLYHAENVLVDRSAAAICSAATVGCKTPSIHRLPCLAHLHEESCQFCSGIFTGVYLCDRPIAIAEAQGTESYCVSAIFRGFRIARRNAARGPPVFI